MKPLKQLHDVVTQLPRGGYLIDSRIGYIQFGAPPETIKDTMLLPKGAPLVFVLPTEFFNWLKGISIAELEFPIYYNYFIQKKKTYIICNIKQAEKFRMVLQESLFGPENPDFLEDFESNNEFSQNIKNEIEYFRSMNLHDVVEFCIYENNTYTINGLTIVIDAYGNFEVYEDKEIIAYVPGRMDYKPKYLVGKRLSEPFNPPLFGMTCLGPSHGYDPYENTSGFIIWLNHVGVMIDPPVNSTEWLLDSNVSPKFIDSIILTHCHADHDAGTFQKILEEGKVTIYTTKTIMMSFLRKYSILTDVSIDYLMSLFDFHPVKINSPIFIHGARFDMFYSLHSIPTIGFKMEFQEKSLTYTSDHNNDPKVHNQLFKKGVIDEKRYKELSSFPWDSTTIFHESGYPPLHTSIEYLNSLPKDIQKKIIIYHIAKDDMPKKSLLRLAKFGMENTLYFKVDAPPFEKTYQILGLLKYLDFFHEISIKKAQEFISIVRKEEFKKSDVIIKSATYGDKFYIIYSGNVSIYSEDGKYSKILGVYDYFGEAALITGEKRSANVIAETDVVLYSIEKDKFINFIIGTEYERTLRHLAKIRDDEAWEILSTSRFMKFFSSTQRTWLEAMLTPVEIIKQGILFWEGDDFDYVYIIRKGEVIVSSSVRKIAVLQKGDIVGSVIEIFKNIPSSYSYTHVSSLSLYRIEKSEFINFLKKNPGLIMKLDYVFKQYMFF